MSLYYSLENLLASIGLGSPLARGVVFAALFALPVMGLKLPVSYARTEEGFYIPKKWSLLAGGDVDPSFKTTLPWFIWPVIGLVVGSLLL